MAGGSFRIFASDWLPAPGGLPQDDLVCAIGDVHGELAHLQALTQWLAANVLRERSGRCHFITLGDYADRGASGVGVLSFLERLSLPGVRVSGLLGNHDVYLKTFLYDRSIDFDFIESWMINGGGPTALELGVDNEDFYAHDLPTLQTRARERLPGAAAQWLKKLRTRERIGSYVFVHAGVHPSRPLEDHDVSELVMMREPFLSGVRWGHDFVVVHGHTICGPDVKPHRIACDSGACVTGVLTCAQIEADRLRFVIATQAAGLAALDQIPARRNAVALTWTEQAAN